MIYSKWLFSFLLMLFFVVGCHHNEPFRSDITDMMGGEYIQLVYIGSSGCSFCSDSLHHEIKELRANLREWAHVHNQRFISTGVSVDLNSEHGIRFLKESGPYDEIISGASWYNLGAHHYIWNEKKPKGSTPQIRIQKLTLKIAASATGKVLRIEREVEMLKSLQLLSDLKDFNGSFNPQESNWVDSAVVDTDKLVGELGS